MRQDEIRRIAATGADGTQYIVVERRDRVPAGTMSDPQATIPGLFEYRLTDGRVLNKRDDAIFQIVESGELIRAN